MGRSVAPPAAAPGQAATMVQPAAFFEPSHMVDEKDGADTQDDGNQEFGRHVDSPAFG
jgi:hypothetical protein